MNPISFSGRSPKTILPGFFLWWQKTISVQWMRGTYEIDMSMGNHNMKISFVYEMTEINGTLKHRQAISQFRKEFQEGIYDGHLYTEALF